MWISKSGDDNNIRSLCVYINIESYFPHFSLLCVTHVCFCRRDKGRISGGEKVKCSEKVTKKCARISWKRRLYMMILYKNFIIRDLNPKFNFYILFKNIICFFLKLVSLTLLIA